MPEETIIAWTRFLVPGKDEVVPARISLTLGS